jgi:hypothetical protein
LNCSAIDEFCEYSSALKAIAELGLVNFRI